MTHLNAPDGAPIDPTLPEMVQRFLASGARLQSIRLDDHGRWWHQGAPFDNDRIIGLFSRSLDRTEGGTWVLNVGRFTYPIEVDDVGFFVDRVTFEGQGSEERALLHLSDGSAEPLSPDTLEAQDERGFLCAIKSGRFQARFKRPAYYALADRVEESVDGGFALRIGDALHPL